MGSYQFKQRSTVRLSSLQTEDLQTDIVPVYLQCLPPKGHDGCFLRVDSQNGHLANGTSRTKFLISIYQNTTSLMASKSAAASGEKKKSSSSRKNKEKPSSRNSAAKDKEKTRSSKKSSKKSSSPSATTTATTTKTEETVSISPVRIPHDPDAIQLFRRYDRARAGALTRLDFLQLLKDYANPPTNAHTNPADSNSDPHARLSTMPSAAHRRPRKPLSLTETSGIPLGFERSDKNSEFEAGQLFERYDKDRTGALTLDKFHTFFADFKPQLTAFVDDFNYFLPPSATPPAFVAQTPTAEATLVSSPPLSTRGATPELDPKSKSDTKRQLKSEYQTALWKLRKLYKEELLGQRERLLESVSVSAWTA